MVSAIISEYVWDYDKSAIERGAEEKQRMETISGAQNSYIEFIFIPVNQLILPKQFKKSFSSANNMSTFLNNNDFGVNAFWVTKVQRIHTEEC